MAKAKYRLEALLRVKKRERQRAEIALAKALEALKQAKEKEKELQREKAALLEQKTTAHRDMDTRMGGGGSIFDGQVYVNFLRKLKEQIEEKEDAIVEQKEEIERATERVARRRRDYIEAAKQLQIMEKHRELWHKRVENELSRKEEKEFDELGNTIHQLRRWRKGNTGEQDSALGY